MPLTLTGHGALTSMDVQTLQAGFPAILPDNCDGRPTVLTDRRQWVAGATTEHRLRCNFYICKVMMEHPSFQRDGTLHVLILLLMPRINDFDPSFVSRTWDLIGHAFPSKAHAHLVCNLPKADKHLYLIQNIIASYVKLVERGCDFADIHLHMSTDEKEVKESLMSAGFSDPGLPSCMGGSWDFIQATEWVRKRLLEEREALQKKPCARTQHSSAFPHAFASIPTGWRAKPPRSTSMSSSSSTVPPAVSVQDAIQKRRVVNAIHSRRKRERRRRELQNLKQEGENCKADNVKLRAENKRLALLLQEAQSIAATLPAPKPLPQPPVEQQIAIAQESNKKRPNQCMESSSGDLDAMTGRIQKSNRLETKGEQRCLAFGNHSFFAQTDLGGANTSLEQTNHGPDVSPILFGVDGATAAENVPNWSLDDPNEVSGRNLALQHQTHSTFDEQNDIDYGAMSSLSSNPLWYSTNITTLERDPCSHMPSSNMNNNHSRSGEMLSQLPFSMQRQQQQQEHFFNSSSQEQVFPETNHHLRHHYDPPSSNLYHQEGGEPTGTSSRLLGIVRASSPQERQQVLAMLMAERKRSPGNAGSSSTSTPL